MIKTNKELEYEIKKTEEIIKNTKSKYLKKDRLKYLKKLRKEVKNYGTKQKE